MCTQILPDLGRIKWLALHAPPLASPMAVSILTRLQAEVAWAVSILAPTARQLV